MVAGILQRRKQRLNVCFSAANSPCSVSDNSNAHRYTTEILASDCGDFSLRITVQGLSRLVPATRCDGLVRVSPHRRERPPLAANRTSVGKAVTPRRPDERV